MSNHESGQWRSGHQGHFDKKQFSEAGEQVGRIVGQFMSMASDLGRTIGDGVDLEAKAENKVDASANSAVLREAGEKLRDYRQAAGYTVESFAEELDRQGAVAAIEAAEEGRSVFPRQWLDRAASLLSNGDPMTFYKNFYECYESDAGEAEAAKERSVESRSNRLADLFHDDSELADLSDEQFEKLHQHLQSHYKSVKALLSGQK